MWPWLALLAACAVLPYVGTWAYDFVHLDDYQFIVGGEWFFGDWANAPRAFVDDVWSFSGEESSLYRPALLLLRFAEAHLLGVDPGPYHAVNTALHLGACALLFSLLRTLTDDARWSAAWASLFALHPAFAPVVAWIEGYNNSLLTVFLLGAMIGALRTLETERASWAVGSAAAFFLALLTKENAAGAPLLAAGLCALHGSRRGLSLRGRPALLLAAVLWAAALVAWAVLRWSAIPTTRELDARHVAASVAAGYPGLLLYWGKILLPVNLTPLPTLRDASLAPGALCLALYVSLVARSRRPQRLALLYGAGWFVVLIAPSLLVSRLGSPTGAIYREDRLYQASVGPWLALAMASREWLRGREVVALRAAAAVGALALALQQRNVERYRDALTFYRAAVDGSPSLAMAHTHLADQYMAQQRFALAHQEYERALALNPSSPDLHNNYAILLARTGELDRADEEFRAEIALHPDNARAHLNRARLLRRRNDLAAAAESYERYLALTPQFHDASIMARLDLVGCYRRLGRADRVEELRVELARHGARLLDPRAEPDGIGRART